MHWDGSRWSPVEANVTICGMPPATYTCALMAIWGSSPTNVLAGGSDGVIYRWNGTAWSYMHSDSQISFYGASGSSGDDVVFVGDMGRIIRYHP